MQIIPMRDLKNTVEVERRCAEENGPVYVTKNGYGRLALQKTVLLCFKIIMGNDFMGASTSALAFVYRNLRRNI